MSEFLDQARMRRLEWLQELLVYTKRTKHTWMVKAAEKTNFTTDFWSYMYESIGREEDDIMREIRSILSGAS